MGGVPCARPWDGEDFAQPRSYEAPARLIKDSLSESLGATSSTFSVSSSCALPPGVHEASSTSLDLNEELAVLYRHSLDQWHSGARYQVSIVSSPAQGRRVRALLCHHR